MKTLLLNLGLCLALAAAPLWVELATLTPGGASGAGLELLLHRPFRYAYPLAAFLLLVGANVVLSLRRERSVWVGALYGVVWMLVWFCLTFLALVEFYFRVGGAP